MDEPLVLVGQEDAIAIVTLNRPQAMNALSSALRKELSSALAALDEDDAVKAVILTGMGERAFSAGLDLAELASDGAALSAATSEDLSANPVLALEAFSKPVIGANNGAAITGGLEVALACDILIASEKARFADTHVRVGVMPGWGLSQKLSRLIGIGRAKELSFSGNFLDARTACVWGLVNRVVPAEALLSEARALAHDIASADLSFLRMYKQLLDQGFSLPFGEGMALERRVASKANSGVTPAEVDERRQQVIARGRKQGARK